MASGGGATGRRPGRPARIGQREIVGAALDLGLDAFTMRGIAEHLGVTTPALYSHVAGRDEVLALVNDALARRMRAFTSDAPDWRAWLADFARAVRRDLASSAAALTGDLRAPATTLGLGIGERGLQLLLEHGLPPAEAGRAVWLVFRLAVTAGPPSREALAGLVGDTGAVLGPGPDGALPATRAVHDALAADGVRDTFDDDLALVLDGIARRIDAHGDPPAPPTAPSPASPTDSTAPAAPTAPDRQDRR